LIVSADTSCSTKPLAAMDNSECLHGAQLEATVREVVASSAAIDVHTHLFPHQHGGLLLWGIDELLTYHYLVSEFFMVAPASVTHADFFASPKSKQADLVWKYLFLERSPISEAQLGVLTCLRKFGLGEHLLRKDLAAIRAWFEQQSPLEHTDRVFDLAGLRYVVMTNVPFDHGEADTWVRPTAQIDASSHSFNENDVLEQTFCSKRFKTALRCDPILKGDWGTILACLATRGLPETLEGARAFLRAWAKVYSPEYVFASTPADFVYGSADTPRQPGWPTATKLIDEVLLHVAKELGLPVALKLGAKRGMNEALNPCGGGDGVCISDVGPLEEMCRANPTVKFLATFLSRVNQHEVCVLAQKFRNLHIYGCWWYCNNPSIIEEMTRMRLEMLHTAFTAQHSDSRVLDQLVYKWSHSRRIIGDSLCRQYRLLDEACWPITLEDVQRDVGRLLGGSYEEFLARDLTNQATDVKETTHGAVGDGRKELVPIPPPPQAGSDGTRQSWRRQGRNFERFCLAQGSVGCGCC